MKLFSPSDPPMQLPPDQIPEPSPTRMHETLAATRQLFRRQRNGVGEQYRNAGRPFVGRTWMEAILGTGLLVTACALVVVIIPQFGDPVPPGSEPLPREAFRTGMRQDPGLRPASLDMIAALEPVTFGNLKLGVRNVDNRFGVYFVNHKGLEQELVTGSKSADEKIGITDAILTEWSGRQVLSVRYGFGDLQRWEAFVHDGFGFARSAALSRMIWDAAGGLEVRDRLQSTP